MCVILAALEPLASTLLMDRVSPLRLKFAKIVLRKGANDLVEALGSFAVIVVALGDDCVDCGGSFGHHSRSSATSSPKIYWKRELSNNFLRSLSGITRVVILSCCPLNSRFIVFLVPFVK